MASKPCCDAGAPPAGATDNAGKGKVEKWGDMNVYVSGKQDAKAAVVVFYDIFGFDISNTRVLADRLGEEAGVLTVMPDFYRGEPWDLVNFPPPDKSAFGEWWGRVANSDIVVKDLDSIVLPKLKELGVEKVGAMGFCWGGLQAIGVAAQHDGFAAAGSVHGARLTPELVEGAKVPCLIFPSGDDPVYEPLKEVLDKKPFGDQCVYKNYTEEIHGFCAARGDWSVQRTVDAVNDVVQRATGFFTKQLA